MWRTNRRSVPDTRLEELETEIRQARADLALAYRQFDMACDPELVEACIYQIQSLKARYNYLLRTIKARRQPQTAAAAAAGGRKQWI